MSEGVIYESPCLVCKKPNARISGNDLRAKLSGFYCEEHRTCDHGNASNGATCIDVDCVARRTRRGGTGRPIDPAADRAAELLGRVARLVTASLPSPTVAHLVRTAEAARDHSQRLSARPDEHRMAQDFAAIAQAFRIAESATDHLHRIEGVSLELRVMRDRIEGIGRTIVPPLDAADLPPGFARALGELDELGASLEARILELRKAKT